jgi:transcriptional regulator with XRE-family HTH domain
MSQKDFSESLGTSFGYINMVINGRRESISRQLALLIEEKYGYCADWILYNEGDKKYCPFKDPNQYTELKAKMKILFPDEIQLVHGYNLSLAKNREEEIAKHGLKKQHCRPA